MRRKQTSANEPKILMLACVITGVSGTVNGKTTSQSAGMKEYDDMKDNRVSLRSEELVKQLLSDRHAGKASSIIAIRAAKCILCGSGCVRRV
jgi:hypothetical protein